MDELKLLRVSDEYKNNQNVLEKYNGYLQKTFPNFNFNNNTIITTTTTTNNTIINIVNNNYMSKSGRICTPRKKSLPYPKLTPYKIPNPKVYYYFTIIDLIIL